MLSLRFTTLETFLKPQLQLPAPACFKPGSDCPEGTPLGNDWLRHIVIQLGTQRVPNILDSLID